MVFILFAFLICALAVDGAGWSPWQGDDGGSSFSVIKPTPGSVDYITTICVHYEEPPDEVMRAVWAKYESGNFGFSQGYYEGYVYGDAHEELITVLIHVSS